MNLTPVQIAVLALAVGSYLEHPPPSDFTRHMDDHIAVWGSWEHAARRLRDMTPALLADMGPARGTREMEWRNLKGKHRRGRAGRLVHVYQLAHRHPHVVQLAARCAWAVQHKSTNRNHVTWKDVPAEVPRSPWAPHGHRCPDCGCVPGKPCAVELPDGCGEGTCVPAGVFGFKRCTACQLREAA